VSSYSTELITLRSYYKKQLQLPELAHLLGEFSANGQPVWCYPEFVEAIYPLTQRQLRQKYLSQTRLLDRLLDKLQGEAPKPQVQRFVALIFSFELQILKETHLFQESLR